ncbi:MAG: hypothetical protein ACI9VS_002722, partial [Candidatus Binatia bacterium]
RSAALEHNSLLPDTAPFSASIPREYLVHIVIAIRIAKKHSCIQRPP